MINSFGKLFYKSKAVEWRSGSGSKRFKHWLLLTTIMLLLILLENVDARGGKKKVSSLKTCADVGLDCHKTCCLGDRCGVSLNDIECTDHVTRPFLELYVGLGILIVLLIGIPFVVKCMNCLLLAKFC